ncbi:hypothetical protein ACFQL1_14230 [Halomicroarcula sp. GCM10025709]|uniref:hypothetical protein n=1 Tax=Halomicroarcula sp. GCM10025709 TaxID=3252669 RepID=UPI00361B3B0E
MDTIGFICERTHPVFWPVAERLAARGFDVRFFEPGERITRAEIGELAALVNKKIRPESFAALHYADRIGVPTWNGFFATTALSCRLVALNALEAVGCRVPAVHFEKPPSEYVAKGRYSWTGSPTLGGEGISTRSASEQRRSTTSTTRSTTAARPTFACSPPGRN